MITKRFLFYLVHPAKFHFHKVQIRELKSKGHIVDIVINTKDVLEELLKEEGWEYTNLFPKSRKIDGLHVYMGAGISFFLCVYRLWQYARRKRYDVFIGDALMYLGRLRNIPSFYPTDDVLAAVPAQISMFIPAHFIVAPEITDIGKFKKKKIAYRGYKALAHLHPNHFMPDNNVLDKELQNGIPFFIIRCTGFGAIHDLNKTGITDDLLFELEKILLPFGKILISTERSLPHALDKYKLNIRKTDISHYIAFARLFIGDSTTMSTEAAVLGTPSIEFDDYFYEIEQMLELEQKYKLIHCFRTHQRSEMLRQLKELLVTQNLKKIYEKRRKTLLNDTIDVSAFLTWLLENHPESTNQYFDNPYIQLGFK